MAKDARKSRSKKRAETTVERMIREAKIVAYAVDRDDWLMGRKPPLVPTTVALTPAPSKRKAQRGPQIERVLRVLPEIYPPNGKVPPSIPTETVRGKVAHKLAAETKQLGLATARGSRGNHRCARLVAESIVAMVSGPPAAYWRAGKYPSRSWRT